MRAFLTFATTCLILALNACSSRPLANDFTQSEIDGIAEKCGARRNSIAFSDGWVVISEPDKGDSVKTCIFNALKRTGKTNISILGNKYYSSE